MFVWYLVGQMSSLGNGSDHVADAICQCEQYAMQMRRSEAGPVPWFLLFQKELFSPWHDTQLDNVATDVIYQQVITGIMTDEYICAHVSSIINNSTLIRFYYFTYLHYVRGVLHDIDHYIWTFQVKIALCSLKNLTSWFPNWQIYCMASYVLYHKLVLALNCKLVYY